MLFWNTRQATSPCGPASGFCHDRQAPVAHAGVDVKAGGVDAHGELPGLPLGILGARGVAHRGRVADLRLDQFLHELHRLDVARGHHVELVVGGEQAAAVVDHHHDHGVRAEVIARARAGAEAVVAVAGQGLADRHHLVPRRRWREPELAEDGLAVPPDADVQLPRDRHVALGRFHRRDLAGQEVGVRPVLLELGDQVIGIGNRPLLGELERLETAARADGGTGARRNGRGERLVEVGPLDCLVSHGRQAAGWLVGLD